MSFNYSEKIMSSDDDNNKLFSEFIRYMVECGELDLDSLSSLDLMEWFLELDNHGSVD